MNRLGLRGMRALHRAYETLPIAAQVTAQGLVIAAGAPVWLVGLPVGMAARLTAMAVTRTRVRSLRRAIDRQLALPEARTR